MTSMSSGLNAPTNAQLGAFTDGQNQAILIVGLSCSCVSLVATLITLRWFILMKRLFRHRLVLFLLLSDFFKAIWYFVFPIVVFTRGQVQSSSAWCQAQGWLLSFGIEAADFAIFLIALHAMLYIFRPPVRIGKGGLYKYRKWIPLVWLGPPALLASLAFVNNGQGYVTSGTFCYLPKRPIWYRLALTYIPRYIILIIIFGMYAAISIYVHVKFQGFRQIVAEDTDSQYSSDLERTTSLTDSAVAPDELVSPRSESPLQSAIEKKPPTSRPNFARGFSYKSAQQNSISQQQHQEPWDAMNFITSKPLQDTGALQAGVQAADFAPTARGSASSEETRIASRDPSTTLHHHDAEAQKSRQPSEAPTVDTQKSNDPKAVQQFAKSKRRVRENKMQDPLYRTRSAIRQQLRFLFVYPAVYALMWAFPFAQNCTLYSSHYAEHPLFWLQVMTTAALSLQATVDCLVFSWREKPWRRVDENSKFSIPFWRDQSVTFIKRMSFNSAILSPREMSRKGTATNEVSPSEPAAAVRSPSPNWWEAEGKKRKDSVWMGTDLLSRITNRQSDNEVETRLDTIEERSSSV